MEGNFFLSFENTKLICLFVHSGAFSRVCVAEEKSTGKKWAIKIINKKNTGPSSMKQEIDIMSLLNHAHVVNFKEIFDTSDQYYVVLE